MDPLGYRRAVFAASDGGKWTFGQSGQPYPFEDLSAYAQRPKRDRFTRERLEAYLGHFGIRPFDESFFRVDPDRPAIVVEDPRP